MSEKDVIDVVAVDPTEVVEPVVESEVITDLVLPSGRAIDIWTDVDSTFVPALRQDMTPEERKDAVRAIAQNAQMADDTLDLVLGELLYEVIKNGYWREWEMTDEDGNMRPYKSMWEYSELELGIKKRAVQYRISVYEKFVIELDLDKDILRQLDWSKARLLVPIIDEDNKDELLAKIKDMSYREVVTMIKAMRGLAHDTDDAGESILRMIFSLYPEQHENVERALSIAKGMSKSDKPGNALDLICTDFVGSAAGDTPDGALVSLGTLIKHIERSYGVELEIKEIDEKRYGGLLDEETEEGVDSPSD